MIDPVLAEGIENAKANRLDIIVFFGTFVGGAVLYFLLHVWGAEQRIVTAVVVGVMVIYAVVVAKVPRLRVRLDQAGDNAYYLGLLFTLVSMAVALWEFGAAVSGPEVTSSRSGTQHIIANFGVALASTITGIFLRLLLHQMRVDPADVESMTRIELSEASKRIKAALDNVTADMGRFHQEIRQRTEDVTGTVLESVKRHLVEFTDSVTGAAQRILETTETVQNDVIERSKGAAQRLEEISDSARQAIERLRTVEPPPLKLAKRLETICVALESLNGQIGGLAGIFQQTGEASSKAVVSIAATAERLTSLNVDSSEHQRMVLRQIAEAATQFRAALLAAGEALQQDKSLLAELEIQSKQSAGQVAETHRAAADVLDALTTATNQLTALVTDNTSPGRA